ncbi:sugar ABC transporter permease [Roseibium sediminis]|uniref:sugar ABC transporter permease n=1 Tax=Roseibium sediminis TaxID=1775174 RepID=UPI001AD8FD6A|nr:sugar ABC transporter permease [Roseibium sediminis]
MSVSSLPPVGTTPLARREARLAWGLLAPTIISVALVVVLPLLAIFWISVKPIGLADLRPPQPLLKEALRGSGEDLRIEYRLRNSSQDKPIRDVVLTDTIPDSVTISGDLPDGCTVSGQTLRCVFEELEGGYNERIRISVSTTDKDAAEQALEASEPRVSGDADSILTNATFTFDNFIRVFDGEEFSQVLGVTLFYTVFGTIGALVVGLFAALLLNKSFKG